MVGLFGFLWDIGILIISTSMSIIIYKQISRIQDRVQDM